jgi:hypothetical protein
MTNYATQAQRFGLCLEASRGTAETTPTKWYPTRGLAEMNYGLKLLPDTGIRGSQNKYAPVAGIKMGEGKLPLHFDPNTLGEICYSLMGAKASVQQGVTAAYAHTFTRSGILPPAYTFFLDRSLGVLKYNRVCVKSLSLKGSVDGLVEAEADVLFQTEASGSIGSPSFPTQRYQSFANVDFKIAGSSNTNVKEWDLKIDNGAKALRTLALSQDLTDIVAPDLLSIKGGFLIYFANTTERDKFIANTAVAIRVFSVGATIASTYKYTVDINIYEAHYDAFPYGEDQGLLAAKASFEGFYSSSDSKALDIILTNTDTSY